jgi:hypothetical protein
MSERATYSHSVLQTARRCLREYDFRYLRRFDRVGSDRETLEVGSCWHDAHEAASRAGDINAGLELIHAKAPNLLWIVKLTRLLMAHAWRWQDEPLRVIAAEQRFEIEVEGVLFVGMIDAVVETPDGRRGIMERKTTSDGLDPDSLYWNRLRMDPQCGIYTFAAAELEEFNGELPSFTLYDVVRKPTIRPKKIGKKDVDRMRAELADGGGCTYFADAYNAEATNEALARGEENEHLYGSRLTSDIGDRPEYYFARREVPRTENDLRVIQRELLEQVRLLEQAAESGTLHRNPDACAVFGTCDFFGLCSHGVVPAEGEVPKGFDVRAHRHPELGR